MYVLFITIAILGGYLICCVYNLLWLAFPCMATLHRVMKRFVEVSIFIKCSSVLLRNLFDRFNPDIFSRLVTEILVI